MRHFLISIILSLLALIAAYYWGGFHGVTLVLLLGILEISLSFDNAILNSIILKKMSALWRTLFLSVGILIAVFGMRLVFPVLLVSLSTDISFWQSFTLALHQPEEYSKHVMNANTVISAFGGMFLILVFLSFLINHNKEIHWINHIEKKLKKLGEIKFISLFIALIILFFSVQFLSPNEKWHAFYAGVGGIIIFSVLHIASTLLNQTIQSRQNYQHHQHFHNYISFLYLEVLDASFSFDGVIAAFAITKDIILIMIGLGIGALFVRSLTIFLVQKRTLEKFIFLEHGAHYAIGILGIIMLMNMHFHVPEIITGLTGVGVIGLSIWNSLVKK